MRSLAVGDNEVTFAPSGVPAQTFHCPRRCGRLGAACFLPSENPLGAAGMDATPFRRPLCVSDVMPRGLLGSGTGTAPNEDMSSCQASPVLEGGTSGVRERLAKSAGMLSLPPEIALLAPTSALAVSSTCLENTSVEDAWMGEDGEDNAGDVLAARNSLSRSMIVTPGVSVSVSLLVSVM